MHLTSLLSTLLLLSTPLSTLAAPAAQPGEVAKGYNPAPAYGSAPPTGTTKNVGGNVGTEVAAPVGEKGASYEAPKKCKKWKKKGSILELPKKSLIKGEEEPKKEEEEGAVAGGGEGEGQAPPPAPDASELEDINPINIEQPPVQEEPQPPQEQPEPQPEPITIPSGNLADALAQLVATGQSPAVLVDSVPTCQDLGIANVRLGPDFESDILAKHNRIRRAWGMPDLSWDNSLLPLAQRAAAHQTQFGCTDLKHVNFGENLAAGYGPGLDDSNFVCAWYSEYADWLKGSRVQVGHFTQILWRRTTKVACALDRCRADGVTLACKYDPDGNVGGYENFWV
ncbi:hypothetical protein HDV05_005901 [Chytridiales sp. JEL 0842]|nr:hypothetical protein HDV05_005901 [Chytridiales sp. JEL 0842]